MKGDLIVHMVHVAGTRMKCSGIDGLSRGDLLVGIMAHKDPLSYFPIGLDADERSGGYISKWLKTWWGPKTLLQLSPEQWFEEAHTETDCLWTPPLAAASLAMEMISAARFK